jgi:myo-inositol-1(or 4)-monophosphatase
MKDDLSVYWLRLAQEATLKALDLLRNYEPNHNKSYYLEDIPREIKSELDNDIESTIINHLKASEIPILSEECGLTNVQPNTNQLLWIIDPLDGTLNFTRKIGPSAVSIALFKNGLPIVGVVGEFPSGYLYWGGPNIGAYKNSGFPLKVSIITNINHSIICTGLPSRYSPEARDYKILKKIFANFSKVRAIGSAAISLVNIAKGSAECYFEKEIMIWDVGAGLAIIEGAGGYYKMHEGSHTNSKIVVAANTRSNCDLFI